MASVALGVAAVAAATNGRSGRRAMAPAASRASLAWPPRAIRPATSGRTAVATDSGAIVGPGAGGSAAAVDAIRLGAAATTGRRGSGRKRQQPERRGDDGADEDDRSQRPGGKPSERGWVQAHGVRTIPCASPGYHRPVTPAPASIGAAQLLRSVGLLVDGPGQWGRPLSASGPGVFAIELAAPLPSAPIELTRVGKWLERVETLRLDGARPTSKALAARLAAFWLPSQTVLYVGGSDASIARRVASMARTELGDRRPSSSGHWLGTLRGLDALRIWWAPTDATEEYEDALLEAFAQGGE